jgi:MtN3 and saliva related transmembrane protein
MERSSQEEKVRIQAEFIGMPIGRQYSWPYVGLSKYCWPRTKECKQQDWRLRLSWEELVGSAGGALITVAFIPQVWRLYRLKSAREISLPFNLLFLMGGVCWLVYGISKELLSVIVSNAVNLTLVLAMLYAKMKYGRQP